MISVLPGETRVALVHQGLLQEVFLERSQAKSLVGNIYKGKVLRILPGVQSAFVDLGEERAAFLHVKDLLGQQSVAAGSQDYPDITQLVHEGKELLVQVTRDPTASKGARVTARLSLASRFMVYLPFGGQVGVSRRIEDHGARERLQASLAQLLVGEEGCIVRTAAEVTHPDEFIKELGRLRDKWQAVAAAAKAARAPCLVHEELPLALRVIRDLVSPSTTAILTDDAKTAAMVGSFLADYLPEKQPALQLLAQGQAPFERYGIEEQIAAALAPRVPLGSGGYLIIDQTEAMVTIDVNTGASVSDHGQESAIYRTNMEAAAAIARQLRLRNLGGLIVIDFIDMADEDQRRQVMQALQQSQKADPAPCRIIGMSELCLVEMTRKRTRSSLLMTMCEPCKHCQGRGLLKSPESVCLDILRQMHKRAKELKGSSCLVLASQTVIDHLADHKASQLSQLQAMLQASIACQAEPSYTQEQYDLILSKAVASEVTLPQARSA